MTRKILLSRQNDSFERMSHIGTHFACYFVHYRFRPQLRTGFMYYVSNIYLSFVGLF